MGVSFLCPVHGDRGAAGACYLGVWFENPLDGGPRFNGETYRPRKGEKTGYGVYWRRAGQTFDSLTLDASVDAPGHWHGYIRAGEVTNATLQLRPRRRAPPARTAGSASSRRGAY